MKRWTVLLAGLLLSGCTAVAGASSDVPSTPPTQIAGAIVVNGERTPTVLLEHNGMIYAPVTALQDDKNRQYVWDESRKRLMVFTRPSTTEEPYVDGPLGFEDKIGKAIALLRERAPEHYQTLVENAQLVLAITAKGDKEAANAYYRTNVIGLSDIVTNQSIPLVAAVIAHEAEHLKNYHERPDLFSNNKENERSAYQASLDTLERVGGTKEQIEAERKKVEDPLHEVGY